MGKAWPLDNSNDIETEEIIEELEVEDAETVPSTDQAIEKRYDEGQASILIQRNDFLVPNLLEMFDKREVLDITPPYQRRTRWTDTKRSHLIESLLMNIPIPPIFLYERSYAQYEVMDGQQRLASVRSFFRNEFKLSNLRVWKELNGRDFRDLPLKIQRGLERRGLSAVIILAESGKDPKAAMEVRQYVFERLNTGGERLNAQEIRNCLYASAFNEMLIETARNIEFTSAWSIPAKESSEPHKVSRHLERNPLYSKMADCEIVLRYFALTDLAQFKSSMKRTLDDCMIRHLKTKKSACTELKQEYLGVLKLAKSVYGDTLFRLPKDGELAGRRSVPLADAVLLSLREHNSQRQKIIGKAAEIRKATKKALLNEKSYELLVGRGNTKTAVEERIELMKKIVRRAVNAGGRASA